MIVGCITFFLTKPLGIAILAAVLSYLLGSVNFSIIISKIMGGKDIRESGSGNAGATNMLRTYGKKMGILVLVLDILKGVVAVCLVRAYVNYWIGFYESAGDMSDTVYAVYLYERLAIPYIAGVCVILGHNFPLYFGFKGGKGVATSLGVVLVLDWKVGLIVAVCAIAVMAVTRYVSLGSILGGAAYIIAELIKAAVTRNFYAVQIVCVVIIGGLLILRHKENIKRLIAGTENKLGAKNNVK